MNATVFVDERMRVIQPTAVLQVSAAFTEYIIDPLHYMVMMLSILACGAYAGTLISGTGYRTQFGYG